jgi:hypothetical protein
MHCILHIHALMHACMSYTAYTCTDTLSKGILRKARYMALAPPHLPLRFSGMYAGDRPPSGSGSCQRGRARGIHRPRWFRPCSELPGISWRLGMQNLAHFAMLTWPAPPPPLPAQTTRKLTMEVAATSQMHLCNTIFK